MNRTRHTGYALCIKILKQLSCKICFFDLYSFCWPAVRSRRGNPRQGESENVDGNTRLALDLLVYPRHSCLASLRSRFFSGPWCTSQRVSCLAWLLLRVARQNWELSARLQKVALAQSRLGQLSPETLAKCTRRECTAGIVLLTIEFLAQDTSCS